MPTLFPEEKFIVSFKCKVRTSINGNFTEYAIGNEEGILSAYTGKDFSGYEFHSDNGMIYFISTVKSQIPQTYDAAFWLDPQKEGKLSARRLAACKKHMAYVREPDPEKILKSWTGAFNYQKEIRNTDGQVTTFGLRPPQIGALHAIQSHWSISKKAALVVMPTGTGKTETMLALTVAEQLQGMLVIVPSASLRTQLFQKFSTLGILKEEKFNIVARRALNPLAGFLKTGVKTPAEADLLFKSNVIISTPQIITGILNGDPAIKNKLMDWCRCLVMDEAHHSQAKEWNRIKLEMELAQKAVLLFTATPFRNDKKRLQGKIIYDYPLSLAQKDTYFRPINFYPIVEFNPRLSDQKIADKALAILGQDLIDGYDHILMARVDTQDKAERIFEEIYKPWQQYSPVFIHSGIKASERNKILEGIKAGRHKIIVCVDMLGEGFDLPQLKICALHDLHKNITTSFQFFGRFTRESNLKLKDATIVANIVDPSLKGTLKTLYQKDSDWNKIISQSNEALISGVAEEEAFFQNFTDAEIPAKIPLRNITPAMSTVVFKLYDEEALWQPDEYKTCFSSDKYETVSVKHEEENLLVVIARRVEPVKWGKIDDLLNCDYELYIFYLNSEQKLLYVNSTNNSTTHNKLAEAIVGKNISLFNEADIYKSLDGIFQLELFNLGLKSTLDGPISFTMYAGNGIVSGLDELDQDTKSSSNLFGVGYENGEKITIGCSSKGRVWTKLVKTIPDFCLWCDALGSKLLDDTIDARDIFSFIQKPERIISLPPGRTPVSIKWSEELYAYAHMAMHLQLPVADYQIRLAGHRPAAISFSISSALTTATYQLVLDDQPSGRGYHYELLEGTPFYVEYRHETVDVTELFYEYPPVIWFHDNSKLYNNIFFPFKGRIDIFNADKLITRDWSGVDIRKESQKKEKRQDSIQFSMLAQLKADADYQVIFDDDDANEASDIVAIKFWGSGDPRIVWELYHCKYSSQSEAGGRLKDLYEVCGQAQRSFHWKHNAVELLQHMIRRQNSRINQGAPSRYEKGGDDEMKTLLNMLTSGYCKNEFNIYVVQPGISKAAIKQNDQHLRLFGATDLLLKKTGNEFYVITSG